MYCLLASFLNCADFSLNFSHVQSLGSILKEYSTLQIFVGCAVESCESVRTQINDLVSDKHQFNMSDFRTNKSLGAVWNALIHQVHVQI